MLTTDTPIENASANTTSSPRLKPGLIKLSGDGVFFTLQGEGRSIGKPAVFIRLHICNLNCVWCDSPYTWNKNLPEYWSESRDITVAGLAAEIRRYATKIVVITGGEPLLQQAALIPLAEQLSDLQIEIETNGTIAPNSALTKHCMYNVSPKLENSEVSLARRIKPAVLKAFNLIPGTVFKFVVDGLKDLDEIKALAISYNIDPEKIIIMPQGTDDFLLRQKLAGLAERAKELGWRLLPRLHVQIWGNQRAV